MSASLLSHDSQGLRGYVQVNYVRREFIEADLVFSSSSSHDSDQLSGLFLGIGEPSMGRKMHVFIVYGDGNHVSLDYVVTISEIVTTTTSAETTVAYASRLDTGGVIAEAVSELFSIPQNEVNMKQLITLDDVSGAACITMCR
jgi:hypothetical protein